MLEIRSAPIKCQQSSTNASSAALSNPQHTSLLTKTSQNSLHTPSSSQCPSWGLMPPPPSSSQGCTDLRALHLPGTHSTGGRNSRDKGWKSKEISHLLAPSRAGLVHREYLFLCRLASINQRLFAIIALPLIGFIHEAELVQSPRQGDAPKKAEILGWKIFVLC